MKRYFHLTAAALVLHALALAAPLKAATPSFDGEWTGVISYMSEGSSEQLKIRLVIKGDTATQYFGTEEGGWAASAPEKIQVLTMHNNCLVAWVNQGGIWSESQMFSLSLAKAGEAEVIWTRHVNNQMEGESNDIWSLRGKGTLKKKG